MKNCDIEGCDRKHYARGLCHMHYQRLRSAGDAGPADSLRSRASIDRACSVKGCESPHACKGFCKKHYRRWRKHGDPLIEIPRGGPAGPRVDPVERFWAKVDKSGECWLWLGGISPQGYGNFWLDGTTRSAHRFAYEQSIGPIPEGMQLDHLCRARACVNPAHLQPVTPRENLLRSPITVAAINSAKTHCVHGHEFTPENTLVRANGARNCRACLGKFLGFA